MSEGGFLNRWAQRKAQVQKQAAAAEAKAAAIAPLAEGQPGALVPSAAPGEAPAGPDGKAPGPDLSLLPSLDSITAATDIKGFLQAGVPDALRNAALRQMWTADPAIRDYIGPYDYAWDFNKPGDMLGFGELPPDIDVGSIVRQIMDGAPPAPPEIDADEAEAPEAMVADSGEPQSRLESPEHADEGEAATEPAQSPAAEPEPLLIQPPRRRHGGATPR